MNLCIIQARMGSTRMPGKVLRDANGKTILQNIVDRISPAKLVDEMVVATSNNPEDNAENKIRCSRGSDWDVLDRFYQTAISFSPAPENIIRICCDNPLHGHREVDFVIGEFLKLGVDYFSNSNHEPHFLEDGFDTEVFSFRALEYAWREAKMLSEREHVTPFIKQCGKFKCGWRKANALYHFKLSVDTENDFLVSQIIFKELGNDTDFGITEVVDLILKKPELLEFNKESIINEGYRKSLREDRRVN